ncbi:MAG: heat-inducible transcriptional repressor HrcA [Anaerolineae bacterium]
MSTDEVTLPELTRRQEEILSCVVRAYTDSPEPISSKYLVETYHLSFSSATIRNEMAVLEELGYLTAPHTSAGRVPTENGYRYFVKRLIPNGEITPVEKSRISDKLRTIPLASEQWLVLVATLLARTSHVAALVTPPVAETSRFKHVELISIQGRLVLMVLVLQDGAVHQQMLTLAEPVAQPILSESAERINALCMNMGAKEVRVRMVQMQLLEREVAELAADQMDRADTNQVRLVYRNGLSEVLGMFQSSEGAQRGGSRVRGAPSSA